MGKNNNNSKKNKKKHQKELKRKNRNNSSSNTSSREGYHVDIRDNELVEFVNNMTAPGAPPPPQNIIDMIKTFGTLNDSRAKLIYDLYSHYFEDRAWNHSINEISSYYGPFHRQKALYCWNILFGLSLKNEPYITNLLSGRVSAWPITDPHRIPKEIKDKISSSCVRYLEDDDDSATAIMLSLLLSSPELLAKNKYLFEDLLIALFERLSDSDARKFVSLLVRIIKLKKLNFKTNEKLLSDWNTAARNISKKIHPMNKALDSTLSYFCRTIFIKKKAVSKEGLSDLDILRDRYADLYRFIFGSSFTGIDKDSFDKLNKVQITSGNYQKLGQFFNKYTDTSQMDFSTKLKFYTFQLKLLEEHAGVYRGIVQLENSRKIFNIFKQIFQLFDQQNGEEDRVKPYFVDYYIELAIKTSTFILNLQISRDLLKDPKFKDNFLLNYITYVGAFIDRKTDCCSEISKNTKQLNHFSHVCVEKFCYLLHFFAKDRSALKDVNRIFFSRLQRDHQQKFWEYFYQYYIEAIGHVHMETQVFVEETISALCMKIYSSFDLQVFLESKSLFASDQIILQKALINYLKGHLYFNFPQDEIAIIVKKTEQLLDNSNNDLRDKMLIGLLRYLLENIGDANNLLTYLDEISADSYSCIMGHRKDFNYKEISPKDIINKLKKESNPDTKLISKVRKELTKINKEALKVKDDNEPFDDLFGLINSMPEHELEKLSRKLF